MVLLNNKTNNFVKYVQKVVGKFEDNDEKGKRL